MFLRLFLPNLENHKQRTLPSKYQLHPDDKESADRGEVLALSAVGHMNALLRLGMPPGSFEPRGVGVPGSVPTGG